MTHLTAQEFQKKLDALVDYFSTRAEFFISTAPDRMWQPEDTDLMHVYVVILYSGVKSEWMQAVAEQFGHNKTFVTLDDEYNGFCECRGKDHYVIHAQAVTEASADEHLEYSFLLRPGFYKDCIRLDRKRKAIMES